MARTLLRTATNGMYTAYFDCLRRTPLPLVLAASDLTRLVRIDALSTMAAGFGSRATSLPMDSVASWLNYPTVDDAAAACKACGIECKSTESGVISKAVSGGSIGDSGSICDGSGGGSGGGSGSSSGSGTGSSIRLDVGRDLAIGTSAPVIVALFRKGVASHPKSLLSMPAAIVHPDLPLGADADAVLKVALTADNGAFCMK
eukprot:UC1_evm1s659